MNSRFLLPVFALIGGAWAQLAFGPEIRVDHHIDGTTGSVKAMCSYESLLVAVWNGAEGGGPLRVWCSVSADSGQTWSWQVPVSDEDGSGCSFQRIDSDSLGSLYAVWQDYRGPEPYAVYFSQSEDGGSAWLQPNVRVTDLGEVGVDPDVAADSDGSCLVVVFNRLDENRIYSSFSLDGGQTWSPDVPVGDSTGYSQWCPAVCWLEGETFTAVWEDNRDSGPSSSSVYCSVSLDGGGSWNSPDTAIPSGGNGLLPGSISLQAADGVIHAAWIEQYFTDFEVNEVYYSRSSDGGSTWLPQAVRVDQGGLDVGRRGGGLWAYNAQNISVCWCEYENSSFPILALCSSSSDSGSSWSMPVSANPEHGEAYRCDVAGGFAGEDIILIWTNQIDQHVMSAVGSDVSGFLPETGFASDAPKLSISPCPCSTTVLVSLDGNDGLGMPEIRVSDICGRRVAVIPASMHSHSVVWDVSDYSSGVYLLSTCRDGWLACTKVVVIH